MGHYLIDRYVEMHRSLGRNLTKRSEILDFCCGKGEYVQAFREDGFSVHGFEPFGGLAPDEAHFKTLRWPNPYTAEALHERRNLALDWSRFAAPYRNYSFDFIFSQTVLEHTSDHDSVFRELARITAFDGTNVHTFPGRYQLIEPHIKVPLGGLIKSERYYRAWLTRRPFNPWPIKDLSPEEVASLNIWYARGSLFYPSIGKIKRTARKYFRTVRTIPRLWDCQRHVPEWLYTRFNFVVLFLAHPIYH